MMRNRKSIGVDFGTTNTVVAIAEPGEAVRWGRRWSIAYALSSAFPGLILMATAHLGGDYAGIMMTTGAVILGFTALSSFTIVRVYLSEQFPTALRGRGNVFGEAFGRIFAGVLAPFLMEPHVGNAFAFFGTITVVLLCGAFIPVLFGKETVGQLETVTERGMALGAAD
jgi:MFS family permease